MPAELKLLRKRLGATTVYVTHDQVVAMIFGDRVAVLAPHSVDLSNNLQQCDYPQQVSLYPRNMLVAGFIGSPAMNFVYADLSTTRQCLRSEVAETSITFDLTSETTPVFAAPQAYAGKLVVMGARPKFMTFAQQQVVPTSQPSKADILILKIVGPEADLYFTLPAPEVGRDLKTVLNASEEKAESGAITLHMNMPRVHVLDADTSRIC